MALSDDLLLQRRNNQGLTRQLLNQSANLPKPSPEQLQQWNNEAKNYAYQADGLRGSFRKLLGMNPYTNNYPSASRIGTEIASIPPVQSSSTRQLSDFEALGKNAVSPIPRTASSSVQNGEPTSIQGVTKQLINGVPTYSNAPNQDASGLGIIPSIRQNSLALEIFYNQQLHKFLLIMLEHNQLLSKILQQVVIINVEKLTEPIRKL